ncbi:MAG: hypothetical protein M3Z36_03485 [Acidobacteriota bacterium]|nr:hypothetical protein [Acidobacteriota bacterium]
MSTAVLLLCFAVLASVSFAASDVRFDFTLNATDALPETSPMPMIPVMEASPNSDPAWFLHRNGDYTETPGTVWNNNNPRVTRYEDFDYTDEVISRVRASENGGDAFITGISKGGHRSFAYAGERPWMIEAAGPLDEFMGSTSNFPSAPGTLDTNVPFAMVKESVDASRAADGLLDATPVTTFFRQFLTNRATLPVATATGRPVIPGATEATYSTTPTTRLADHLTLFRCVLSNSYGNATSVNELLFVTSPR